MLSLGKRSEVESSRQSFSAFLGSGERVVISDNVLDRVWTVVSDIFFLLVVE
jgi:hypothetical protein